MKSFSAKLFKIGINPYVLLPEFVLQLLFKQAGKDKGAIPVRGTLNGKVFTQTLESIAANGGLNIYRTKRSFVGRD